MKRIQIVVLIALLAIVAGCAPQGVQYTNIGKLDFPIKTYPKKDKLSELSLAISKPEVIITFKASNSLKAALRKRIESDALSLACHLTQEMKKILIAKGFTVTETFDNLNAMTFTQKRNTSALFTAFIKIEINEDTLSELLDYVPQRIYGTIASKAKLQVATIEPLSGEIIWLKNVPVQSNTFDIEYPYYRGLNATETLVPAELVDPTHSIDGLFTGTSNSIVNAIDKFVDVDEFKFLNTDIKKLKKIKRY